MRARLLARLRQEGSEAGETLLEVLISSALMALVVLALVGAVSTIVIGTRVHRHQADANVALVEAMEKVRVPEGATTRVCLANDGGHPYHLVLPDGVTISSIEYQTPGEDSSGNPIVVWSPDVADCDVSGPQTLQRITLQYVNADSTVDPSLAFVKGKF
jgi:Tfp pilus assembly protein PilV